MQKKLDQALTTWDNLNDFLREASVADCNKLIKMEIARSSPRRAFVMRIHSRMNKVRAHEERLAFKDL